MWLLPDGRLLSYEFARWSSRDKIVKPNRSFTQAELDATAEFLNRQYSGGR